MSVSTNSQRGFSLIEGLVAIAIAAVVLVAVISVFPLVIKSNKHSELESMASVYAKAKIETILTTPYDELTVGTIEPRTKISSDPLNPAYNFERQAIIQLVDGNLNQTITDIGLKKITVTVYWANRFGGDNSLILSSLASQK
jgi:prepilin-type N-terminal cleavage/methylation domain-containing protein